jgi:hypothetical protein
VVGSTRDPNAGDGGSDVSGSTRPREVARSTQLEIRVVEFSPERFQEEVRRACGAVDAPLHWRAPAQVQYLGDYLSLSTRKAKAMLIETPYIDRHYIEEYQAFYCTALNPPSAKTTRIHFFEGEIDVAKLQSAAVASSPGEVERAHHEQYIGFVVVRPLPDAPIGRTVLGPYKDQPGRHLEACRTESTVHVLGLEMRIAGVPFQQQEQAVGACATTAVWSALARASRADGGRAPTPFSVTSAATRHVVNDRILPASGGLDIQQMTDAIRWFGFSPLVLKPDAHIGEFLFALRCYLRSGIPAVLHLDADAGPYHAVAAVGFRDYADEEDEEPQEIVVEPVAGKVVRCRPLIRLYAHDDRLGPYVRFHLVPNAHPLVGGARADGRPWLQHRPYPGALYSKISEPVAVNYAIFPLYPKLRLSASDLLHIAGALVLLLNRLIPRDEQSTVEVDARFEQSGRYLRELFAFKLPHLLNAATTLVLPRYIGVLRYSYRGQELFDVLCDTTDIRREDALPIVALVPFDIRYADALSDVAARLFPRAAVVR